VGFFHFYLRQIDPRPGMSDTVGKSSYPLNVVEVLKNDRQWGRQNTVSVVNQPRFLNLIS
jgi:hypothetical protein